MCLKEQYTVNTGQDGNDDDATDDEDDPSEEFFCVWVLEETARIS